MLNVYALCQCQSVQLRKQQTQRRPCHKDFIARSFNIGFQLYVRLIQRTFGSFGKFYQNMYCCCHSFWITYSPIDQNGHRRRFFQAVTLLDEYKQIPASSNIQYIFLWPSKSMGQSPQQSIYGTRAGCIMYQMLVGGKTTLHELIECERFLELRKDILRMDSGVNNKIMGKGVGKLLLLVGLNSLS